jgi:hypothetical protein
MTTGAPTQNMPKGPLFLRYATAQSDKTYQCNGFTNTNPTPNTNSDPNPNPYTNPNLTLLQIRF